MQLPPIPPWEAAHPLIVHFPIALLLVAPLFLLAALVLSGAAHRVAALFALLLLALGTGGAFAAVASGEDARAEVAFEERFGAVLDEHEEKAERARTVFAVLTGMYAVLALAPRIAGRELSGGRRFAVHGVFLALYLVGLLLLGQTASLGGRLVHEFGIHAGASTGASAPAIR